ncbi:flavodoxin family protein [Myxococcota bacterium]|nr:flavodoxin family protein [Myxococcota bacterium]MBU1410332.1 flavodoxin family protein [Myxococcota bacterium]MBU1509802.1 flavodoxin family protein [Myxococcota bacterium]
MQVLMINGSPKRHGNTARLLAEVAVPLQAAGITTELVQLADTPIQGCHGCGACGKSKNNLCAITSDALNTLLPKLFSADGIVLGSPVYFADVSSEMLALIHRAGMVSRVNGDLLRRKVAAGVVAVRRGGAIHAFDTLNHFFLIGQMIVAGSNYWNIGLGRLPGEVENDAEGMGTMRVLGENMAWLLEKINRD